MNASRPRGRHSAADKALFRLLSLLSALLLLAMAAPLLIGRIWVHDDLGAFHLPVRAFYWGCLRTGQQFDWMPSLFCGFDLTGEGQAGTYHPWHFAVYRLFPLRWAFGLELLASYPALLLGMYAWLRRQVPHRAAALYGAMVFTFSGFNLLHFVHPNAIAVIAHLPWLLLAIGWLGESSRPARAGAVVSIALLTGSQVLLGYPQYVWFSLLVETAYAAVCMGGQPFSLVWLFVGKAAGLLLGAVQILPTWEALAHAQRLLATEDYYLDASWHPLNAVQLVAPYLFRTRVVGVNTHELACYLGAAPLLLGMWLLMAQPRVGRRRGLLWMSCCLGVFALLLAGGRYVGLYRLHMLLPIIGRFRAPARYLVLVYFALAPITAIAFSQLQRGYAKQRLALPSRKWLAALPLLSLALTILLAFSLQRAFLSTTLLMAAGPSLCAVAAVTLGLAMRRRLLGLALLSVVTAVDLGGYGLSYAVFGDTVRDLRNVARVHDPAQDRSFRLAVEPATFGREIPQRFGNRMLLRGWSQADGYIGLTPQSRLFGPGVCLQALQSAHVQWVWGGSLNGPVPGLLEAAHGWLQVPRPASRFRLITSVRVSADPRRDISGIDPQTTALVETPLSLAGGLSGRITIVQDDPGRIRLKVDTPTRQLLAVSESFHRGWHATIHKTVASPPPVQALPILRINGDFLGVVLEPGQQEVCLRFNPRSLRQGKWVSLISAGFLALAACILVFKVVKEREHAARRLYPN